MPVVGFLGATLSNARNDSAFQQAPRDAGFVEGQNAAIAYRWADGRYDRLPALASDLVRQQVSVIVASSPPAALAAKAATAAIASGSGIVDILRLLDSSTAHARARPVSRSRIGQNGADGAYFNPSRRLAL